MKQTVIICVTISAIISQFEAVTGNNVGNSAFNVRTIHMFMTSNVITTTCTNGSPSIVSVNYYIIVIIFIYNLEMSGNLSKICTK